MLFGHPPLSLIGSTVAPDVLHRREFVGAVQQLGDRLQPVQHIDEVVGDQALVAVGVLMITASRP